MSELENFGWWLHGYLEINDPKTLGEKETKLVKKKLEECFHKITPDYTRETPMTLPIYNPPPSPPGWPTIDPGTPYKYEVIRGMQPDCYAETPAYPLGTQQFRSC